MANYNTYEIQNLLKLLSQGAREGSEGKYISKIYFKSYFLMKFYTYIAEKWRFEKNVMISIKPILSTLFIVRQKNNFLILNHE